MSYAAQFNNIIEWFIPPRLLQDREMRIRARMFMLSHAFGPILGNVIPAFLFWIDPTSSKLLAVLAGSICSFWIFPFLLKYTGRYELLSFLSIQNLLFAILWGCYYYGGLSSPFLPWLVTVPLLAFFYLGASMQTCVTILFQVLASLALFMAPFAFGINFPHTIPLSNMAMIGVISIVSAAIYVSMMALFYAKIHTSQSEYEAEVRRHLETADELRSAAQLAEQANAAKAEFLAKMSHELRTPLNAVIGYSQILLEDMDVDADPQGTEDLNKIHDAGHQLLRLVNSILDLSKIEAGKMEIFPETVNLSELTARAAVRWGERAAARNNEISVISNGSNRAVSVDYRILEQMLDELVDNSNRYMKDGRIELILDWPATEQHAATDVVSISVRDSGPGIPSEMLSHLFETFDDRDDASDSKYGGAGLGLPLCDKLCRLLSGSLTVETAIDVGSTFTIALPCGRAETDEPAEPAVLVQQAA